MQPTQALLALLCIRPAAPLSTTTQQLREAHRSERLNLLNHPLQIQLATGALPYGSFVRLCHDRSTILEAVRSAAAAAGADVLGDEVSEAAATAKAWLDAAEAAGKTISTGDPSIKCYACGGDHLNVDYFLLRVPRAAFMSQASSACCTRTKPAGACPPPP